LKLEKRIIDIDNSEIEDAEIAYKTYSDDSCDNKIINNDNKEYSSRINNAD
jgi:hypothetical protein